MHVSDWKPGGRIGTHDIYTKNHESIFGKQDIFKNLSQKDADESDRNNRKLPANRKDR